MTSGLVQFTGKERDVETGLDWMKTRYFSGAQGRFTSPDRPFADQFPEDPQSWNLYSYVRNNPLKMVDEDGQSATLVGAIGGGIFGGAVAAWRGESVWKGAAGGSIAGAVAGSVIDTGGASLGVLALSGAAGGLTGGVVSRGLNGEGTTLQQAAVDAAVGGTVGVVLGAGGKVVGTALSKAAAREATAAAVEAADAAQAGGRTSGAAAGLRVGNQTFADVSTGGASRGNNPAVQRALDNVPASQRSPYHGACAEIGCLNQAANAGVNPQGGTMRAVNVRKPGNANHATPKPPCPTCEHVQNQMGVN